LARAYSPDGGIYQFVRFYDVRLRGYYVAWASRFTDISCGKFASCPPGAVDGAVRTTTIKIHNVRRRRSRTVAGAPLARTLKLTTRGAVAWASGSADPGAVDIRASLRVGDNRLLDSGNIVATSLSLTGSKLVWVKDGLARAAILQ